MSVARGLVVLSAVVFAGTGLGYLIAPGAMLAVVGVASVASSDFLLRTEGVALLCGAVLLWAIRDGTSTQLRVALIALGAYYILGSIVDIVAFREGIVGAVSVPSAAVRTVMGAICLVTAARLPVAAGRLTGATELRGRSPQLGSRSRNRGAIRDPEWPFPDERVVVSGQATRQGGWAIAGAYATSVTQLAHSK